MSSKKIYFWGNYFLFCLRIFRIISQFLSQELLLLLIYAYVKHETLSHSNVNCDVVISVISINDFYI